MVALGWLRTFYIVVDAWWVAKLGEAALAAVAAAAFAWWIFGEVAELPARGAHSLVARAEGAEDPQKRDFSVGQAAWVSALLCVVLLALGRVVRDVYFTSLHIVDPETLAQAHAWWRAFLWILPLIFAASLVSSVFRGLGWTRPVLWLEGAGMIVNAVLDPFLMWGIGPFPELGIQGVVLASGVGLCLPIVIGSVLLWRRGVRIRVGSPGPVARKVFAIGAPVSIASISFSLVYVVLGRFLADFGDTPLTVLGIGHRLEGFAYLTGVGFLTGAATLVGQALGAGDREAAASAVRAVDRMNSLWMVGIALAMAVLARPLFEQFSDDPAVVDEGVRYLRIQAAVWLFMGWELVYEGAFTGAATTAPPMVISGILTFARIPMAWFVAFWLDAGLMGVWLAIALSTASKGVALRWWFWRSGIVLRKV